MKPDLVKICRRAMPAKLDTHIAYYCEEPRDCSAKMYFLDEVYCKAEILPDKYGECKQ